MIEGRVEVKERWGRRCRQLLDDLKENMRTLEEGTLDDTPFGELSLKWLWMKESWFYSQKGQKSIKNLF